MSRCQSNTKSGIRCKLNGGITVQHSDHTHIVCVTHKHSTDFPVDICAQNRAKPEQLAWPFNPDLLAKIKAFRETNHNIPVRVMVTGHSRLRSNNNIYDIFINLLRELKEEFEPRGIIAVSGGSLGADQIWARAARDEGMPFELYVPCGYETVFIAKEKTNTGWVDRPNAEDLLERFHIMCSLAIGVFDERGRPRDMKAKYVPSTNWIRNQTMVDVSQVHIAVSNTDPRDVVKQRHSSGGTEDAILKIWKAGHPIIWIPNSATLKATHYIANTYGKEE